MSGLISYIPDSQQDENSATKGQSLPQSEQSEVMDYIKKQAGAGGTTANGQPQQQVEHNEVVDYAKQQTNPAGTSTYDQILIEPPKFQRPRNVEEFLKMNPEAPETPEQRLQREKRERTNKIIAGVGDMISALSNMYFTTKGAPNGYDPKNSLSAKMQARYDQLNREREIRDKDYRSGLMRAQQLDDQQNLSWENLKRQYARDVSNERLRQQKEAEAKAKKEADEKWDKEKMYYESLYNQAKGIDPYKAAYYYAKAHRRSDEQATAEAEAAVKREANKGSSRRGGGRGSRNTDIIKSEVTTDKYGNKTTKETSYRRGNASSSNDGSKIDTGVNWQTR